MAAPKRTAIQIAQDRTEIARLYLRGETQAAIAVDLGVTQQQISYDLEQIQKEWRMSALRDFDAARAQELAKIDAMEREYWLAWDASKQEYQTSVTEIVTTTKGQPATKGDTVDPKRSKAQIKKEDRTGDPRYLTGVMSCIERRCKLLGLDAPTKNYNYEIPWDKLTPDQVNRLAAGEDPEQVVGGKPWPR